MTPPEERDMGEQLPRQSDSVERWHGAGVATTSLAWEAATGADSIDTIERVYPRTNRGAYRCGWPGCTFARRSAEEVWRHVHSHREVVEKLGGPDLPPDDFDPGSYL